MKVRRQIGGRYLARVRGAFRGGQARPRQPVDQPDNPETDGATRATRVRPGVNLPHPDVARSKFRDLAFHS